jgi:hypothetical protein
MHTLRIILPALALLTASCARQRGNELAYRMATDPGWELVDVDVLEDGTRYQWSHRTTGDSARYVMRVERGNRIAYEWERTPYTWWDDDLGIVRWLRGPDPLQDRTELQRAYGVDRHGRSIW